MNPSFYFLLALTSVLAVATDASRPVLDTDGDALLHGSSYYVISTDSNCAGGLSLVTRREKKCPLSIRQFSRVDGIPVKFSNWRSGGRFVPESENLNIKMEVNTTMCSQSSYWTFDTSGWGKPTYVVAGPKFETDRVAFQIMKGEVQDAYKFALCSPGGCENVGIYIDREFIRHLVLYTPAHNFVFKKADDYVTKSLSKTM